MSDRAVVTATAARFATRAFDELKRKGMHIDVRYDFDGFLREACAQNRVVAPEQFDPNNIDLLNGRGFWLHGQDADGGTAHIQAMRLDMLAENSLADYLKTLWPRLNRGRIEVPSELMERISGSAAYSGAAWTREDFRHQQIADWACRLAHSLALMVWWPGWIYGLIDVRAVDAGHARRWGFSEISMPVFTWQDPPPHSGDFALVAARRSHTVQMTMAGHEEFFRRASPTPKSHPSTESAPVDTRRNTHCTARKRDQRPDA